MANLYMTIENAMNSLSEYEELDDFGKSYLLDELIDIMEDLQKTTEEGRFYESITIIVEGETEFPKPFTVQTFKGALGEQVYEVHIKQITSISRLGDNRFAVDVLAQRIAK